MKHGRILQARVYTLPNFSKKTLLGTSKDLGKKASYRDPRLSSNGVNYKEANSRKSTVYDHPANVNYYAVPTR